MRTQSMGFARTKRWRSSYYPIFGRGGKQDTPRIPLQNTGRSHLGEVFRKGQVGTIALTKSEQLTATNVEETPQRSNESSRIATLACPDTENNYLFDDCVSPSRHMAKKFYH